MNNFDKNGDGCPKLLSVCQLPKEFDRHSVIFLTKPNFTIGRSLSNSEVIACVSISRLHCTFHNENNSWKIQDSSRYGVQVNGKKVGNEPFILCDNDVIQFDLAGEFVYKFAHNGAENNSSKKRKFSETFGNDMEYRIQEAKDKFDNSQIIEKDNMKKRMNLIKQKQIDILGQKENLEKDLESKCYHLEVAYQQKIIELKGKNDEVEKQKVLLKQQNEAERMALKEEMNKKVTLLEEKINEQKVHESSLEMENKLLLERLEKEREEFEKRISDVAKFKEQKLADMENQLKQKEEELLLEKRAMESQKLQEIRQFENAKQEEFNKLQEQIKSEQDAKLREIESLKLQMEMQEHMSKETRKLHQMEFQTHIDKLKGELAAIQMKMTEQNAIRIAEQTEEEANRASALENYTREKTQLEVRLAEMEEEKRKLQALLVQQSKQTEVEIDKLQKEQVDKEAAVREQFEKEKQQLVSLLSKDTDSYNRTIQQMQQELQEVKHKPQPEAGTSGTPSAPQVIDLTGYDCPSTSGSVLTRAERIQAEKCEINRIMDNELQCSICSDLFITPTTLNCTHTFCKYCIETWKKKKKECPVCRSKIKSQFHTIILESLISSMVETLGEEAKQRRQQTIKERQGIVYNSETSASGGGGPSTSPASPSSSSSSGPGEADESSDQRSGAGTTFESDDTEEYTSYGFLRRYYNGHHTRYGSSSDSDGASWTDFSYDSDQSTAEREVSAQRPKLPSVEGLPGSYYGGYGSCYKCNFPGHWAPGCPFL